jgi:hypothetical protein
MSNVLSSLQVVLGADTAAFQQDLGRASESANDHFGKIGGAAKAMATTLAAALTVDYFAENIKKAIDYADSMSDLAGKTGIATEELTAMEYALHFSDATLENYTEGLKKLTVNMVSSIEGNKDLADTFKKLKIDVEDGNHNVRQSKDVFLDAAEAISKMQDGAVKTDLAMKLFGKSAGPELIPFMNQGKEGIKELTAEAQKMGAVVSTDMANQSAQFNDSVDKMGYAAKGMWNTIAQQLTPSLNGMATSMVKGTSDGKVLEATAKGIGIAFHAAFTAISFVVTETEFFGDAIGKVAAVVSTFASDGAAAAKAVWNDQTGNIKATEQLKAIAKGWTDAGQAATESAKVQTTAADTTGGKALGGNGKTKDKKIKPAKAPTLDKSLSLDEIEVLYNEQNAAENVNNAAKLDTQRAEDEAASQKLYAVYDEQNAAEITNNALKLDMQRDFVASFLTMDRARVDGSVTNGDAALEAHKKQQQMTVTFFQNGLDSMAAGHGKAAKAAQAIQKAQALYEIGVNTYRAATGAYAALSPIPIVGPALGIAAAAAAIAFGGSMAQGVMKGGGAPSTPSVSGSTPSSSVLTGSNEIVPISQQQNQTTYIRIPEDRMMTGRQLIDFIDEALGDGKQFNNFRFIPA